MTARRSVSFTRELSREYTDLFASCSLDKKTRALVETTAKKVHAQKARYRSVEETSGVPWYVVGALHALESGQRFDRHLHNGDPLAARTTRAPKNRPCAAPPFSWEQSALDALDYEGMSCWSDWSVGGTLYRLEAYNGFNYRLNHPGVKSPYLWSFTSHYKKGRYAADGRFDADLIANQIGAAALLRALDQLGFIALSPRGTGTKGGPLDTPEALGDAGPPPYPGRLIKRGEPKRAIVLLLQGRLLERGCGPLDVDGEFGGETEGSVRLFQSRSIDRNGFPLHVDGIVGPSSWEALFGQETVTTVEPHEQDDALLAKALEIAASQVGVRETPGAPNTGKEVNAYLKSVSLPPGNPWCVAFTYWCFDQAAKALGVANPHAKTGGVLMHWELARRAGTRRILAEQASADPSLLMPGQLFIMDHGGGKGHTGMIESVQGGMLVTIEGNTNGGGSREGDGVYRRTQRDIRSINTGFIDYGSKRITGGGGGAPPVVPTTPTTPTSPAVLAEIAAFVSSASAGGLLRRAVEQGIHEQPTWIEVPFAGLTVRVGAHALRANVGGRLLRLPVSYADVIAISKRLGWIAPTAGLADAIWMAAKLRISPAPQGDFSTPAAAADTSRRMSTLEFVAAHDRAIEAKIPANRRGELAGTEGKDWILSKRNLLKPRDGGGKAGTTYGWHQLPGGEPIQGLGPDASGPAHSDQHFDYSQTLRPIQRMARRADGTEVDLADELVRLGLPAAVLAPFKTAPMTPSKSARGRSARASEAKGRSVKGRSAKGRSARARQAT